MKKIILLILVILLGIGIYFWFTKKGIFKESAKVEKQQLNSDSLNSNSEQSATAPPPEATKQEASETGIAEIRKNVKLKAYNFKSTGLRMKINNTPEYTTKSRNCVQIISSFKIGEDTTAPPRQLSVYLQIVDPEGNVLKGRSGSTVPDAEGKDFTFSGKKEINYENKAIDIAIYYDFNGAEPLKGNYKVNIFCDGYVIGSDRFTLK